MTQRFANGCGASSPYLWRLLLALAALSAPLAQGSETSSGSASDSKQFFALLTQPGIQEIVLLNDISLEPKDAPNLTVNLTTNLSITGTPGSHLTYLSANYIASKVRLQPGLFLTFNRIILSGILRGVGQHLDFLTRSDGGSVVYVNSINHRAACLPFDVFLEELLSLPQALPAAGLVDPSWTQARNLSVRGLTSNASAASTSATTTVAPTATTLNITAGNDGLCWKSAKGERACRAPYLDLWYYGTYNQIIEGAVASNGGYNSFFFRSYGICDQPVSYECLATKGADLCLAAALASVVTGSTGSSGGSNDRSMKEAIGLGVGLGGGVLVLALLLTVLWVRHRTLPRTATTGAAAAKSSGSAAGGQDSSADSAQDIEKGASGNRGINGLAVYLTDANGNEISPNPNGSGGNGGGGRRRGGTVSLEVGEKGAGGGSGSTGESGSSGSGMEERAGGEGGEGSAGLGEVEVARLHLMANAARGRGGSGAPLEVKVLQLLGQGSFGKVYKGIWHGTMVALKAQVLPPSLSGDARRRHMAVMEAAISSAINHPSIVQTYCYSFRPIRDSVSRVVKKGKSATIVEEPGEGIVDANGVIKARDDEPNGDEAGADYGHELLLVLEYCDGGSLRTALDQGTFHRGRPWPWDWRRTIPAPNGAAGAATAAAAALAGQDGGAAAAAGGWRPDQLTQAMMQQGAAGKLLAIGAGRGSVAPANTPDHRGSARVSASGASPEGGMSSGGVGSAGGGSGGNASGGAGRGRGRRQPGLGAGPGVARSGTSELLNGMWPKIDAYEPDFTAGAFEVIVPTEGGDDEGGGGGEAGGGGNSTLDGAALMAALAAGDRGSTAFVSNTLAGAPTAATSYISSSFSNAASAADDAAAAAAADRLAMMYLLQQAAAAVAAAGDPGGGNYARALADFVSASNLSGLNSVDSYTFESFMAVNSRGIVGAGDGAAGAAIAAAAEALADGTMGTLQSSSGTMAAPPPAPGGGKSAPGTDSGANAAAGTASGSTGAAAAPGAPGAAPSDGQSVASAGGSGGSAGHAPGIRYGLMLAVAADVASGLMHLHSHGVVHGDVKASNVLLKQIVVSDPWEAAGRAVDSSSSAPAAAAAAAAASPSATVAATAPSGSATEQQLLGSSDTPQEARGGPRLGICAKVSDFGLSTMLSAANTDTHISATTAAGSLSHMSPELLLCGHVSKANDVYAYGILLYELFTGDRAWEGVPRALLPARVALEGWRPIFPPHTPSGYRQLAERCWQADPAKRPSFEDIVSALRALRDAAQAAGQCEWQPVPHPQVAFLQQLLQRRAAIAAAQHQQQGGGQQQQQLGHLLPKQPSPLPLGSAGGQGQWPGQRSKQPSPLPRMPSRNQRQQQRPPPQHAMLLQQTGPPTPAVAALSPGSASHLPVRDSPGVSGKLPTQLLAQSQQAVQAQLQQATQQQVSPAAGLQNQEEQATAQEVGLAAGGAAVTPAQEKADGEL